eukprot:CAMPEP_0179023364 /NCGR_PEP_ID=MMETSP0796-20121207/6890_1 /TAXON_ID=73915 /ORGANISM="Pyrodinium bahamense, Strain pbaha01" /LENGTH=269 /DNA_ID=CAMNT_0020719269 /DNA_START=70 /DNA_END=879 /DNA_ORIENTATION=+
MSDYHQIDLGEPHLRSTNASRIARSAGLLALGSAVTALLFTQLLRGSTWPTNVDGKESLLAGKQGVQKGPAPHMCNCPPSEAIWPCTGEEYRALMNGTTCQFYRASSAACTACTSAPASLECRACALGIPERRFCDLCVAEGLNDVGCRECSGSRAEGAPASGGLGAGLDAHGCRPSAGYRWCEAGASCVRPWELGLRTEAAFTARCQQKATAASLLGGDRDEHGCIPSAGYSWCEAESSCIRPWEHGIHTAGKFTEKCSPSAAASSVP